MYIQVKWYGISSKKFVPIVLIIVVSAVIGTKLWFFVENGYFGGRSLYGAVIFPSVVFVFASKLLDIPYWKAMDFVSPGGCLIAGVAKLQCLKDGCCQGRFMFYNKENALMRFPSQIVEMVVFFLIVLILMIMASKPKFRTKIYPWSLILYGGTRFFLDFLRETVPSYLFGLSAGSFWSLCSFIIGAAILVVMKRKEKNKLNLQN